MSEKKTCEACTCECGSSLKPPDGVHYVGYRPWLRSTVNSLQEQHRISWEFAKLDLGVNVMSPICPVPKQYLKSRNANHRPGYHIERYPKDWNAFRYRNPNNVSEQIKKIGRQQFEKMQKHGWVHGDLHGGNIVTDGIDRVRFIDFEFTCRDCTSQQIEAINRINNWNAKTKQDLLALERQLANELFG